MEAINNLSQPWTKCQLRRFLGMIKHYHDMWVRHSEILAPLTELTSKKVKFQWQNKHSKAFNNMKQILAPEVILAFPDFNKPFHIFTDASDTQLGAVITQENKPIAFYSKKLNPAQSWYKTTEKELLSIVATWKEFRTILLGQQLIIHTDHEISHTKLQLQQSHEMEIVSGRILSRYQMVKRGIKYCGRCPELPRCC